MANLKSSIRDFALAGIAIVLAFAAGVKFLGKPLRLVELVTIIGLGMTAGVSWAQAIWRARQIDPAVDNRVVNSPRVDYVPSLSVRFNGRSSASCPTTSRARHDSRRADR